MSLIDDIVAGFDRDRWFDPSSELIDVEVVLDHNFWDQSRWYTYWQYVYKRDDEYVEVITCEGSTEEQDGGESKPDIHVVYPHEVTNIVFMRVPQ